ncbi:autoinducer 2 ABC transporter substrate-binding protein, partial [Klebsiella pneumoniae]
MFPLCVIPLSDYNVLRLIIMHKRLVVNIFSSLLLGAALISAPVYAAEKT